MAVPTKDHFTELPTGLPNLDVTSQEWQWAANLIRDVEDEERKGNFAAVFYFWKLAMQQFRKLEARTFTSRTPSSQELDHHCACVTALISIGQFLKVEASKYPDGKSRALGISMAEIEAQLFELKTDYEEWHADVTKAAADELAGRIFCATA